MKANLTKLIGMAALGIILLANPVPTWAGASGAPEVLLGPNWALGSLVGARYSADSTQFIGCGVSTGINGPVTECTATDKTGAVAYCFSTDSKFSEVVQTMTSFSFIYFDYVFDGTRNNCNFIGVNNASTTLP
jgi:hypothetical protein